MMPLVVAVTICMLIIILGVAEYMRLVITAAGIKEMCIRDRYKDSVYFADKSMKQQFDMAVETSYQESVLTPVLDQDEPEEGMEQEESAGMSMGM